MSRRRGSTSAVKTACEAITAQCAVSSAKKSSLDLHKPRLVRCLTETRCRPFTRHRRMPLVSEDALTVVRAYHHAWTTHNFQEAAHCLADALVVEVPINEYPTKADFLRAVEMTRGMATEIDVLAEFGDACGALLLYDMQLPMTALRVAEHFTVRSGQITRIRQIHDTAALRATAPQNDERIV